MLKIKKNLYLRSIYIFFILSSFFVNKLSAATINFSQLYKASTNTANGSGGLYTVENNTYIAINRIIGTNFKFTSANPADVSFSGNNILGTLSYNNSSGVLVSISGIISRPDKTGSTPRAVNFVVTTDSRVSGEAYALIIAGFESVYVNGNNFTTSSDPIDRVLNDILNSPNISQTGTLTAMTACAGSNSSEQTFTVSGTNLSANLVVTAPTGYEVSKTSGSGFASSISYAPSSGTVASSTVYVRLKNNATNGASGDITITSTSAATKYVSTGTAVVSSSPTITLGSIGVVTTTATSFEIPYTSTTGTPNQYSITAVSNALPGFSNVTNATLQSSPISVVIPASSGGTYNFDLTIKNSSNACPRSYSISLTVSNINPGVVGSDQSICEGSSVATLTSSSASSGGVGSITYEWYQSTTSSTSGFLAIPTTNSLTYTPGTLTQTTYFYRKVTDASSNTSNTNVVTVEVSPASVGGTIAGSATVCSGTNSTVFTLSDNTGDVTKWQSSTSADFSSALDITNTTTSLTASNLTTTTYYRAVVKSGSCSAANSGTATITVDPASVGGTIAGSVAVCSGTNSTTLSLSGNTGSVTKWQSSTSADFSSALDITNTTTSLTVSNLTATTYYRAVVKSGSCSSANSGTATITVDPASVGGTIAGSVAVCSGTNSTTLSLSGNTGSVTKWQSSTSADFASAIDITNTTTSLTASNITATTYYRAVVQSGSCTAANSGTASITIKSCIEPIPDNNSTSVGVPVNGNVSTNDNILPGTTYGTPTPFDSNPTGATITIDAVSGNYTFTATKPGKYEFYIPICLEGQTSNCQLTLLQITVLDPTISNNPPVANVDIATTNKNTAVTTTILANDKSGNIGTSLVPSSVTVITDPVNGNVVVNADGTLTYTPNTDFYGTDSLEYKVCDNANPANCQSTFVYYKVLAESANSKTSAIDDYGYVTNNKVGNASVSGNLLTNDKNTLDSTLVASLITGPTAEQGTFTINSNGAYTFTPTLGFSGPIDIIYKACTLDDPAICAKATLHIVVSPPPTINPDFNSTNVNTPVPGSINTNDIIPVGTTYGTPIPSSTNPSGATITIDAKTGTYTFTAAKPGKYIFNVPVCAASQTTGCPISPLQITVLDPNITTNPPVANNDYSVTKLNTPVVTTIMANDKPGNLNTVLVPTSIVINIAPKNGKAVANKITTTSSANSSVRSFSTNGTITYTPNTDFVGLDSLIYTVCDDANPANCEVATVYYTISTATPNSVLVANDDYNTSTNRVPATGNVLINDDYGGVALTSTLVTGPLSSQGVLVFNSDGTYTFTPAFGFTGPVDIIYKACSGTNCINATLHILVNLVPPPPPTVINATYVARSKSNPANIKSLVKVSPTGTTLKWCDPTGTTCSTTPPTIPTTPGTYIWCVKSVDTVTLLSSTCAMDTVIILAPYTVMEVTKTVRSVKSNPDGSVLITFVLKAANKTNAVMDSVSIKDDLTQTFNTSSGFSVASLDVYGGLIKNSSYDGVSSTDLVTTQSKIAANTNDSAILKVLVASPNIFGSLTNTAILGGKTKYGYVSVSSNDPLANPSDTTKRVPTAFNVPKADLIIAGGFSPNFDGLNDKWIIVRPFGTRVEVQVFNRWGNIVYQNADYKNDWNGIGTSNFMGEDVPDGTYFYIVNAIDPSGTIKKFTSSLTIVR